MTQVLDWLIIALRTLAALFALVFVIRYSRLPWRSMPEGRHLMSFSAVVVAFLVYATAAHIVPHFWGEKPIGVVLFAWTAFEMWRRNRLLTLARRDAGRIPR